MWINPSLTVKLLVTTTAPVNVPPLNFAKLVSTNAVVATFVVLSPAVGVGAVGDAVNAKMPVDRVTVRALPRDAPASSYRVIWKSVPAFDPPSAVLFPRAKFHRRVVPV
jgi:hypothetical protein